MSDIPTSIDEKTLQQLTLSLENSIQLKPGDTYTFSVGVMECWVYFRPVEVDVNWSVIPAEGAAIDPKTGVMTIDKNTPSGSKFTIVADVLNGRARLSIDVYIYTQEALPFLTSALISEFHLSILAFIPNEERSSSRTSMPMVVAQSEFHSL